MSEHGLIRNFRQLGLEIVKRRGQRGDTCLSGFEGCQAPVPMLAVQDLLSGLMAQGEPIPPPSTQKKGQIAIPLPPMVAAKLAIYQAMLASRLTQSDYDHLEAALSALGKKLVVDVRDAA